MDFEGLIFNSSLCYVFGFFQQLLSDRNQMLWLIMLHIADMSVGFVPSTYRPDIFRWYISNIHPIYSICIPVLLLVWYVLNIPVTLFYMGANAHSASHINAWRSYPEFPHAQIWKLNKKIKQIGEWPPQNAPTLGHIFSTLRRILISTAYCTKTAEQEYPSRSE